ncbi:hypothetical protein ANO11243_095040 [Dothideomycetidae sp. 11243]|nr:hypothetical protein ANO11243_095040 [fungal sp. No.11243]
MSIRVAEQTRAETRRPAHLWPHTNEMSDGVEVSSGGLGNGWRRGTLGCCLPDSNAGRDVIDSVACVLFMSKIHVASHRITSHDLQFAVRRNFGGERCSLLQYYVAACRDSLIARLLPAVAPRVRRGAIAEAAFLSGRPWWRSSAVGGPGGSGPHLAGARRPLTVHAAPPARPVHPSVPGWIGGEMSLCPGLDVDWQTRWLAGWLAGRPCGERCAAACCNSSMKQQQHEQQSSSLLFVFWLMPATPPSRPLD